MLRNFKLKNNPITLFFHSDRSKKNFQKVRFKESKREN